jgi:hypothetical protein
MATAKKIIAEHSSQLRQTTYGSKINACSEVLSWSLTAVILKFHLVTFCIRAPVWHNKAAKRKNGTAVPTERQTSAVRTGRRNVTTLVSLFNCSDVSKTADAETATYYRHYSGQDATRNESQPVSWQYTARYKTRPMTSSG